MPSIPNAERALVAPEKLSRYLLDPTHPEGGPKAAFFLGFGFSAENPKELADALVAHIQGADATVTIRADAVHYAVTGRIVSPDGRNPRVRSVWRIARGETVPRLVTAYSRRRR